MTSCFFCYAGKLTFPLKSSLFPGIDKANQQNEDVREHDYQCGQSHSLISELFEYQRPGEKKDNFDIEQQKQKSDQRIFYRKWIDSILKKGTSALKLGFFCGIGSPRS
jgi:hypothetical protein